MSHVSSRQAIENTLRHHRPDIDLHPDLEYQVNVHAAGGPGVAQGRLDRRRLQVQGDRLRAGPIRRVE
jgi:hypothetical protein